METGNQKVMTFFSHYQTLQFKKKVKGEAYVRPTPRAISSSCSSALYFYGNIDPDSIDDTVEGIWEEVDGKWKRIYASS